MSHLPYFGLKCAGVSSGVSWFRRIGVGRLWKELLYHVQKEIRREGRVPRCHGDVNIEDWRLQSRVAVEQQRWLRFNDMIADRVTD
jgi:hypothetical protein